VTPRAGVATALAAFGLLAALAVATLGLQAFDVADARVADWLAQHAGPATQTFMRGISALHATRVVLLIAALGAGLLLWRHDGRAALTLAVAVVGGGVLNHGLKHALRRPRPGMDAASAAGTDFSFPSGHVALATLLWAALALLLVRAGTARRVAGALALAMVLLVGLSRLVLRAHWLSDVLAGALLGAGWLALCLAAAAALRR